MIKNQNKIVNEPEAIDKHAGIVIQPKDMLSIVVSNRNPELVAMFNLPVISYQAGSETVSGAGQQRCHCWQGRGSAEAFRKVR